MSFLLTLVTPEKKLVAGSEITEVTVPAFRGELDILPGHAPLMTVLEPGVLRYRLKGETETHPVAISWGYCQVSPTGVNILAETAERPLEIDVQQANSDLKTAEARLSSSDVDTQVLLEMIAQAQVARVRQDVAAMASPASSDKNQH
jgi:F-type H+-transporting ATPase subunit epsilon